jgi:integrase
MRVSGKLKDKHSGFESRPVRKLKHSSGAASGISYELLLEQVSEAVSVHESFGFHMPVEVKQYPYNEARLIIPEPKSKDQGWMIKWYAWSAITQKKEPFRKSFDLNEIPDKKRREARADYLIKKINEALKLGKIYDPEKSLRLRAQKAIQEGSTININIAIDAFLQAKKRNRERTYESVYSHLKIFKEWLAEVNLLSAPLITIKDDTIQRFMDKLLLDGKQNRTYNNYLNSISAMFSFYLKKRRPLVTENPCKYIEKLKTRNSKHIAFTDEQQKDILEFCLEKHKNYWTASNFMYYLLARTNELSLMKINDIDFKSKKIYLRSEDSKNWEERWITMPKQLVKIIIDLKLAKYPGEYFIFSSPTLTPGPLKISTRKFGSYFRERVLTKLNFKKGYTFYSWKHTGVIAAYRAGISPHAIRRQTGHKSWVSFEKYLYSLGLFENKEVQDNYPSLPG